MTAEALEEACFGVVSSLMDMHVNDAVELLAAFRGEWRWAASTLGFQAERQLACLASTEGLIGPAN